MIRLKAPRAGETIIEDRVQGEVRFANAQLDDMVLLRSDGTPTYMLSVVVDDHDMAITHIIRGDDHLVNAARQTQLYRALDWTAPVFAHIPADPRRRWRQAVQAPRRAGSRGLSGHGLSARRPCATTCCAWAGAMATTR